LYPHPVYYRFLSIDFGISIHSEIAFVGAVTPVL
jgi:hypothetical protein